MDQQAEANDERHDDEAIHHQRSADQEEIKVKCQDTCTSTPRGANRS
jgi:hypothetical protein